MKLFSLLGLIVLLSACATEPVFTDEKGVAHYSVLCKATMDRCYKKAGKICPSGWNVVEKNNESGAALNVNSAATNLYSMLITCKGQGGAPAADIEAH